MTATGPKRILVIDFIYPLPENIGRSMRTMNFVRFFRKHGSVDLLYFYRTPAEAGEASPFRDEYFVPHPSTEGYKETTWPKAVRGRFRRLAERKPWIVAEWSPKSTRKYVSVITRGNYDIILCRYIHETSPLFRLPSELRKRVIIDFDDVLSESLYGFYAKYGAGSISRIQDRIQKWFLTNYEKKCLGFGAALFTNRSDRDKVAGKETSNAFVVPNIHPHHMPPVDAIGYGFPNRDVFLYIGTLDYGPNIEGLKWFVDEIFRPIRETDGAPRLLVVGRQPTPEVRELCEREPNIELHPDVPEVAPFYRRCGMVVVPIMSGGGTRIKILEAGIAGRPVLSTPLGAHGLDAIDGRDLLLFRDKGSFLECRRRLDRKDTYDSIVESMRTLVESHYSTESFESRMAEVVRGLSNPPAIG
jgi:glycosyltransferase involved in cell wall biosynthesis